jgi:hypothetical protein
MPPAPPPQTDDQPSTDALAAGRYARAAAGDDAAGGGEARRDAFAALLYGLSLGFELRRPQDPDTVETPLADRAGDLAVLMLRDVLQMGFRDATRTVEAITDTLTDDEPDAAVQGLVQVGVEAAFDWTGGDVRAFETRVLSATAGEAFASARPLR